MNALLLDHGGDRAESRNSAVTTSGSSFIGIDVSLPKTMFE